MIALLLMFFVAYAGPVQDVQAFVDLGPRVAGTDGGESAQAWVLGALAESGYAARRLMGPPGASVVVGCQPGEGPAVWVLAHTDSVHGLSPGVIDNAAGVAVALEVGRRVRREELPVRVCFGFPDGEELGFYGARVLQARLEGEQQPRLVIALDLLGQGKLTAMGLGKSFGVRRLNWLLDAADIDVPYAYRVFSRLFPGRERSDHAPFAEEGIPAFLLMGRSDLGMYWSYHTEDDGLHHLDPDALEAAVQALVGILRAGPPPQEESGWAVVVPRTRWVIPRAGLVAILAMGIGAGFLVGIRYWRDSLVGLGFSLLATGLGWFLWELGASGRAAHGALAPILTSLWLVGVVVVLGYSPHRENGVAGGALVAAWMALSLMALDVTLALPWALVALILALGSRMWFLVLLAFPVPAYLMGVDLWRELVFHGVIPEAGGWWMPVRALALWPLACVVLSIPRARGWLWAIGLALALLGTGFRAGLQETWEPPLVERHQLRPQ